MKNPFVYNTPVDTTDFINRELILKNVMNEIILGKTQGDVWITGERKVGKSSLLHFIEKNYKKFIKKDVKIYRSGKDFIPKFVLSNVQYCRNESEFFNELWQSIKNILDLKLYVPDQPEKNFINSIEYATNNNIYIVFLIDEFDAYLETMAIQDPALVRNFINKFNSYLSDFLDFKHKCFGCAFTSNQDFIDLNKKYNLQMTGSGLIVQTFELDWFDKERILMLTKKYLQDKSIIFSNNEIDLIYKYTKGYPYFMQRILYLVYEYKILQKKDNVDELIIKEFAEKEFEQTIKFWTGQDMPKRTYEKLNAFLKGFGKGVFETALKILIEYSKIKFA